jgi:hypothetical protein
MGGEEVSGDTANQWRAGGYYRWQCVQYQGGVVAVGGFQPGGDDGIVPAAYRGDWSLHKSLARTIEQGVQQQTWEYLDRCGAEEGHLLIFDWTPGKPWEEKLSQWEESVGGKIIQVWRL